MDMQSCRAQVDQLSERKDWSCLFVDYLFIFDFKKSAWSIGRHNVHSESNSHDDCTAWHLCIVLWCQQIKTTTNTSM